MARKARYGPHRYQFTLGKRNYNFEADITAIVKKTKNNITRATLQSFQELINKHVQVPVGKGGKMRVKTGFLRASGQMSFNGMPTGPVRGDPKKTYETKPISIVAMKGFQLGNSIFFGWTANYARVREAYDGFLIAGVQNWQSIVDGVVVKLNARSAAKANKDAPE